MKHSHWRGRSLAFFSAIGIAIGVVASPVHADPPKTPPTPLDPNSLQKKAESTPGFTGKWFVQLASKPTISGGSPQAISSQQKTFGSDVSSRVQVTEKHSRLWNGVVVKTDKAGLEEVVKASNVKAVFPVLSVAMPKNQKSKVLPQVRRAGAMTGVPYAHKELGLTGKGMKIGIIDTGIDIDHPAFGGSGVPGSAAFPTSKVVAGYDFVGDKFNNDSSSGTYNPNPKPDPVPDDCDNHGTHVASIAAGNDAAKKFKGVAPDAKLGAYKIAGCEGGFDSDVLLAAMERATKDGMDVVNMSLGGNFVSWPNYPTSAAADAMADSGIVVAASAGNSRAKGIFANGDPSVAHKAISVGSVDNTHTRSFAFKGPDGKLVAYNALKGSPEAPAAGKLELAAYPDGKKTGSVDLPGTPFKGKAVLVARGSTEFHEKALAAQNDGAAAVIIYNNEEGALMAEATGEPAIRIPTVGITQAEGAKLEAAAAAGSASIEWTREEVVSANSNGGALSDFSSFGLAADLTVKPDVLAPGGNIFAAIPIKRQGERGYAVYSGTSMASPHAAGAAALLLQSNTALNPGDVRTVLQNTGKSVTFAALESHGFDRTAKEPIHRQGAGLINVPAAVAQAHSHAKVTSDAVPSTVTPSKVSLGDTDSNDPTELTIANRSNKEVTYTLSSDLSPVGTAGPNQFPSYFAGLNTKVSFSAKTVTVPANSTRTVKATVTPPSTYTDKGTAKKLPWPTIYGGYLVLKGSNNTVQHIPFAGLNADYESLGFLRSEWTANDLTPKEPPSDDYAGKLYIEPNLAFVSSCPSGRVLDAECPDATLSLVSNDDHKYSMDGYDVPNVVMHVENPVSKLEVAAYHANADGSKGKPAGKDNIVFRSDGVGADTSVWSYAWDGTVASGNGKAPVPDGRYVLEVTATKGTGHAQNGKNTDVFTSRPFVVRSNPGTTPSSTASPTPSPTASPGQTSTPTPSPTASPSSSSDPTTSPTADRTPSAKPTSTLEGGAPRTRR